MKTLNDFLNTENRIMFIVTDPYTDQYIAVVSNPENVMPIIKTLTYVDDNKHYIKEGIFVTDWYPVGFGKCVEEAIINLNLRVASFLSDENAIREYEACYEKVNSDLLDIDSKDYFFMDYKSKLLDS